VATADDWIFQPEVKFEVPGNALADPEAPAAGGTVVPTIPSEARTTAAIVARTLVRALCPNTTTSLLTREDHGGWRERDAG
jgi:hypothetical protein